MKPSHLSTPRTLADCDFNVGYPTLYRYERQARRADVLMVALAVVVAIGFLAGVFA